MALFLFTMYFILTLLSQISCLHLSGVWHSKEFFLFLTKFGFQKTDPRELENTQGYIYGNITDANSKHSNKALHLVVVDSEYFLDFYGNSSTTTPNVCSAMFHKIDHIAFDYICKTDGVEDFLRKVPCPINQLCVDEDNPANVIPGYQFTYKIRDVNRPRFWFLSFVSCYRDEKEDKKCEWQSSHDSELSLNYDIWLVNGNPSVKGLNPFEHQFSFELHDVFEIYLIAFLICSAIFIVWLYAFSKQHNLITWLFTSCICGELLSILMNLIHFSVFAYDGVGAEWLGKVGNLLDLATQCLFILTLILLTKDLSITTVQSKWKSVIFTMWAAYTLLIAFLSVRNLAKIDNILSNTDEWQMWPGYATLAFRIVVMFWFLYELRQTFGLTTRDDMTFVMHFGAFFLVWFSYLPALALITLQVSPLWRYKTILSINYAVDILAFAVLVHFFIVEGERILPKFDLVITEPTEVLMSGYDDIMDMDMDNASQKAKEVAANPDIDTIKL